MRPTASGGLAHFVGLAAGCGSRMHVTFFANHGALDQFLPFTEALEGLGHEAPVVCLEGTGGQPRGQYDLRDICGFSDWRDPGCEREHRERAAGVLAQVESWLARGRPDAAVVWGNATCEQRAAVAACRRLGVPVEFGELGWFRRAPDGARTLLVDCVGLHERPTELSLEWWDKALSAEQDTRLKEYIRWWKGAKSSEDSSRILEHVQQSETLPPQLAERARSGVGVLLVLLQAEWDAAAYYAESGVTRPADVMRLVRQAAGDEWLVVAKEHPGATRAAAPQDGELWVRDVNIHDCFAAADCIVTANSNGGLEALLYEKPVICLADAPYGRLGFTFDVRDAGGLRRVLGGRVASSRMHHIRAPSLGNRFLRSFLHYVVFEYCFAPWEAGALAHKLQRKAESEKRKA